VHFLSHSLNFPDPRKANKRGPIAIGGDLSKERLLLAYSSGIFPWYNEGEPIYWYSPDPRMVLFPDDLIVSKSMKQVIRRNYFTLTLDTNFENVIKACSKIQRPGQQGTWITDEMQKAYIELHQSGFAHSVEAWQEGKLVGGLYGVSLGKCFFGESMFSEVSNASKAAFIALVSFLKEKGFWLIDCQVHTEHLESLGAKLIPRNTFLDILEKNKAEDNCIGRWTFKT
jgi:leucyl/phenylalanyl-tRNA--protein transferase